MTKRLISLFTCTLLSLISSQGLAAVYGAPLGTGPTTPISTILADPDSHTGKTLKVQGLIIDVCAARGCWIYIAGDKPFEKLRFKVTDGDMIFPMTARGKTATVEGVLQKFVLSKEEVIARRQHHAEETGEPFDPATVTEGEIFYQLRGLGAEIPDL